jgi:hypothetical protein
MIRYLTLAFALLLAVASIRAGPAHPLAAL